MLNRITRFALVGVFATAIAGYGTAYAQPDDDDETEGMGDEGMEEGMGEPTEEGAAEEGEGGEAEAGGEKAAADEGEAAPAGQKAGDLHAGAVVLLPSGMGDDGEIGLGKYIELRPWASYAVNEKISAGVVIPLLLIKPDMPDPVPDADLLQGFMVGADYAVNDKIGAGATVGLARPGRMGINPFGSVLLPGGSGDLKAGFGVGAGYKHVAGKLKAHAGAEIIMQLDSATDDEGAETMMYVLHVPVSVMYEVNEKINAGVMTGIYTGHEFSFDTADLFTLPLMLAAKYKVNEQIKAGLALGFSSLVTPAEEDVGAEVGLMDTLSIALMVGWHK